MSAHSLSYVVLLGSTRNGRQGLKVAQYAIAQLQSRGHQVELLDALEEDFQVMRAPYHHYGKYIPTEPPAKLTAAAKKLEAADGFLVVDAEYNHSPTPGMLNMLDHFYHIQYKFKSAGLLTYSMANTGGARAAFVLRNTLGELGMISAPSIFGIAAVHTAFDAEGKQLKDGEANTRFVNFLNELDWFTAALKTQRAQGLPEVKQHKPPAATQPEATIK